MTCTLCLSENTRQVKVEGLLYHRCATCQLTFLDPNHRLSAEAEKSRYDSHQNSSADPRYREFLSRLKDPMVSHLKSGNTGLDYGCGPSKTLQELFEEDGLKVRSYDPLYFPESSLLEQKYDFISCSEVVEHFFEPRKELERLFGLIQSGGVLGIMTEVLDQPERFPNWYYRRDPTHVSFFAPDTLKWVEDHWKASRLHQSKRVTVFGVN